MLTRPWSIRDEATLAALAKRGWASKDIAQKLSRSHGATRFKAHKLKVRFNSAGK